MGSRGASTRPSITKNKTSRTAAVASIAKVWVAAQPTCGAWEMA